MGVLEARLCRSRGLCSRSTYSFESSFYHQRRRILHSSRTAKIGRHVLRRLLVCPQQVSVNNVIERRPRSGTARASRTVVQSSYAMRELIARETPLQRRKS